MAAQIVKLPHPALRQQIVHKQAAPATERFLIPGQARIIARLPAVKTRRHLRACRPVRAAGCAGQTLFQDDAHGDEVVESIRALVPAAIRILGGGDSATMSIASQVHDCIQSAYCGRVVRLNDYEGRTLPSGMGTPFGLRRPAQPWVSHRASALPRLMWRAVALKKASMSLIFH